MAEKEIVKETKEEKKIVEDKKEEEKELVEKTDTKEIEVKPEEKMTEKVKEGTEGRPMEEQRYGRGPRLSPEERAKQERQQVIEVWQPKTELGKRVKAGKIKNIDEIIDKKILEDEIIDILLPNLESELLSIGQSKGKFGGGKRRAWKQTQRKTKEGNIPTFGCMAVIGDKNGHIGLGSGRASETLPSRVKALRKARLNIIKITRGCGSFDCLCDENHSVPFIVEGKAGSSKVVLYPAPQGTGLVIGDECKKILKLAGISDVYSKTFGQTKTTINLAKACINALKKTNRQLKK